jgi:hypothetical protein
VFAVEEHRTRVAAACQGPAALDDGMLSAGDATRVGHVPIVHGSSCVVPAAAGWQGLSCVSLLN